MLAIFHSGRIRNLFSQETRLLWESSRIWRNEPDNEYTRNGVVFLPGLLSAEKCDELVALANQYKSTESYSINDVAYLLHRNDQIDGKHRVYDKNTQTIFNVDDLDTDLKKLCDGGSIEEYFSEYLNRKVYLGTCTLQIDDVDPNTKQPWHIDRWGPTSYKLFIYLSDVTVPENSPYSIIPGSHRHFYRKIFHKWLNQILGRYIIRMNILYRDFEARRMLGKKGDGFISVQTAVHKAWHDHREKTRYALVFYLFDHPVDRPMQTYRAYIK